MGRSSCKSRRKKKKKHDIRKIVQRLDEKSCWKTNNGNEGKSNRSRGTGKDRVCNENRRICGEGTMRRNETRGEGIKSGRKGKKRRWSKRPKLSQSANIERKVGKNRGKSK